MVTEKKYAIDYILPEELRQVDALDLSIKFGEHGRFYLQTWVTSRDGTETEYRWIQVLIGTKPPMQHKCFLEEYLVWVTPEKRLQDGWVVLRLHPQELLTKAVGAYPFLYHSVRTVRLRGCISVSPIKLISSSRATRT
jgi:hypothetical protein